MTPAAEARRSIEGLGPDYSTGEWIDYGSVLPPSEYREAFLLERLAQAKRYEEADGEALPWVPVHAWRALGQMGRTSVLEPVLALAEAGHQYAFDDFPRLAGQIGEVAIDYLVRTMTDRHASETTRILAGRGLGTIGRVAVPPGRRRIVEALMTQIRNDADAAWLNGFAAEALMAMDERSVGAEVLRLRSAGHIDMGIPRDAELMRFFSHEEQR
jgi:hypothetical protein